MSHSGECLPGTKLSDSQITFKVEQQFLNLVSGGQNLQLTNFKTNPIRIFNQSKNKVVKKDVNISRRSCGQV